MPSPLALAQALYLTRQHYRKTVFELEDNNRIYIFFNIDGNYYRHVFSILKVLIFNTTDKFVIDIWK